MLEMYAGMILFIVAIVLICAFAALVFGYTGFWLIRNWIAPTTRVRATVVRRHVKQWDFSLHSETPEMGVARLGMLGRQRIAAAKAFLRLAGRQDAPEITIAQGTDCFVTFAANGREMEFNVPEDVYVACDEGKEGLLVYKGEKFRHFIRGIG